MRMAPDDEFKLRFPVAQDRTLRRIAIAQLVVVLAIPVSLVGMSVGFQFSRPYDPRWDSYGNMDGTSPFFWIGVFSLIILGLAIPIMFIMSIIEGTVLTRRYGWRAMKDPIEAQRVAMREALYDVATGSTRADVELDRDGDRIMMVPVRRLRPVGARLELTAEREKAQVPQQGS